VRGVRTACGRSGNAASLMVDTTRGSPILPDGMVYAKKGSSIGRVMCHLSIC
jgi:hypothetical protein